MISFFARNGVAANLLMAAIVIAGVYTLVSGHIPVEVFPEYEHNRAFISVTYRGATPEEDDALDEGILVVHCRGDLD